MGGLRRGPRLWIALVRLTRAVLPLIPDAAPAVVKIASATGLRGSAARAACTGTKHAVSVWLKAVCDARAERPALQRSGPGTMIINILTSWQLAAERLAPLMETAIPALTN